MIHTPWRLVNGSQADRCGESVSQGQGGCSVSIELGSAAG